MKTIFVDESGDLGTRERFFVIAILVPQNRNRVKNLVKHFITKHRLIELKTALLKFPHKQELLTKLSSANDYTVSYIVADKNRIKNEKILEDKNLCYNYLFSFLIRKTIRSSKEDVCILLDNHSTKVKSLNSLCDYIKIKAYTQWGYKHDITISYIDSQRSKSIQATDLVANTIYGKYRYGKNHLYNKLIIAESIKFPFNDFGT